MDVVVLAGGERDAVCEREPAAPNKAFVSVAGVPLVTRTLRALRAAPSVGKIFVVAPVSEHGSAALALADECRPDGKLITQSLESGLSGLPETQTLLAASDLPILSARAVQHYIGAVERMKADLTYGCLERRVHEAAFPQVPHTWVHLRDGTYCGGGLMSVRPAVLSALQQFIERLAAARKQPLRLAALFGWSFLLRLVARSLTIAQLEARASAVLGARARAVVSPYAEMAVNVDRPSDLALAEDLVRATGGAIPNA